MLLKNGSNKGSYSHYEDELDKANKEQIAKMKEELSKAKPTPIAEEKEEDIDFDSLL